MVVVGGQPAFLLERRALFRACLPPPMLRTQRASRNTRACLLLCVSRTFLGMACVMSRCSEPARLALVQGGGDRKDRELQSSRITP